MATAKEVTLTIEVGTTIIVDKVEYIGTVTVDETIAETLKKTGKVDENGSTTNS